VARARARGRGDDAARVRPHRRPGRDGRSTALVSLARGTGGGTARFEGVAGVQGSPRPDALTGDGGDDVLQGGTGSGADTLDGQPARTSRSAPVATGSGTNTLDGQPARTSKAALAATGGGTDTLESEAGQDLLVGDAPTPAPAAPPVAAVTRVPVRSAQRPAGARPGRRQAIGEEAAAATGPHAERNARPAPEPGYCCVRITAA
jgi:hypothetical protein